MSADAMTIGHVVDGRYRIERHAEDSDDVVQRFGATDVRLDRPVELLATPRSPGIAPDVQLAIARFTDSRALAVLDGGITDDAAWLVTVPAPGSTLEAALSAGPPGVTRVVEIVVPVAGVIDAAHTSGLVHGRLGPRCVHLDHANVVVSQIGVAQLAGRVVDLSSTVTTDVQALASLVHYALSGAPLSLGRPLHDLRPGLPPALGDVLEAAVRDAPESASELAHQVVGVLARV
jgi:hypothetical protein